MNKRPLIIALMGLALATGAQADDNQFSAQISKAQNIDEYIGTLTGSLSIKPDWMLDIELDSQGYLSLGTSYSFYTQKALIEPYVNYGKTDDLNIYTAGVFAALPLNDRFSLFADTSYDWRRDQIRDRLLPGLMQDSEEWRSAIGARWQITPWLSASYRFNHDRLQAGNWSVENDNISSHEIMFQFSSESGLEPYIKYTHGEHRVRPGEPIEKESSVEVGISFRF